MTISDSICICRKTFGRVILCPLFILCHRMYYVVFNSREMEEFGVHPVGFITFTYAEIPLAKV